MYIIFMTLSTVEHIFYYILWFIFILKIFEQLIKESQLDLLQDWVITTLSNFTQGLQIPMAIYCLISFFISSSKNKWLRAMYFYSLYDL